MTRPSAEVGQENRGSPRRKDTASQVVYGFVPGVLSTYVYQKQRVLGDGGSGVRTSLLGASAEMYI